MSFFRRRVQLVRDGDGVGVAFLVDRELDRFLATHADDRFALLVALLDRRDIAQSHRHAAGDAATRRFGSSRTCRGGGRRGFR
jgi:hypothetical protein